MTAEGPDLELPPHSPEPPLEPAWKQPEIAWALAILAGFVGASVGLFTRLPGMPELLATAAFAPLFLTLLERRGSLIAGLLGLGWGVGIAGAVLGAVLDERSAMVSAALPLGRLYAAFAMDPLLGGGETVQGQRGLLLVCAWIAVTLLGAFTTRGILGLLGLALGFGAVSGGAAGWALRAVQAGAEPTLACALCFPPSGLLTLAGIVLGTSALAPGRLPAIPEERVWRKRLLVVGLATALLATLAEPWIGPYWAHAVRRRLPL